MDIRPSRRLAALTGYAFAEVDRAVKTLEAQGIAPIDFGVGDPTDPTPEIVRQACRRGVDLHASGGYPSYVGARRFRDAVCAFTARRFGVELDPETEVASTVGSKEGIFHLPEALLNPGEVAICPNPGYPPYYRGARFAEGDVYAYPMRQDDDYLPELREIVPSEVAAKARILWLNYPNSPTGRIAPRDYLARQIAWAHRHDIVVCSDEAYSEIYFTDEAPPSALEVARDGVLVFQSLSKRSAMTGYRIGWVAGDARLVALFKKLKTNIDSGTPDFVQDAAIAALGDEEHVARFREIYRARRDALLEGLRDAGLDASAPDGAIYVWLKLPEGVGSVRFAEELLRPEIAVVCTPGAWISSEGPGGENPGEGYVRFALVPSLEAHQEAARRIAAHVRLEALVGS